MLTWGSGKRGFELFEENCEGNQAAKATDSDNATCTSNSTCPNQESDSNPCDRPTNAEPKKD